MKKMLLLFLLPLLLFGCSFTNMFEYEVVGNGIKITNCKSTEERVTVPQRIQGKNVEIIASDAFYQKTNLCYVSLPQTLTTIEDGAFYRCYSLESIHIPASVTTIESESFFRASSLERITVDTANANYCDQDGVLFNKNKTQLIAYPEGADTDEYTIPTTVCKIGDAAFGYHPKNLRYLTIPRSVTEFPDYNIFIYPQDITLLVESNSVAEDYAKKYNLTYKTI